MSINDIRFVGAVLDNVHGFIHYTEAEEAIMNTQLFKRLQSIKQLSVVNWVFPGSEHTRYIHSLGVMHIADKIAMTLNLSIWERKVLRMAGLLHDIGHYPLSHVGEMPYIDDKALTGKDNREFCKEVNGKILDEIRDFRIKYVQDPMTKGHRMHHEMVGAQIIKSNREIRYIVEQELGPGTADLIADIITGWVDKEGKYALLVQIMHSELDADGIDYLMRDSAYAGTSFGAGEIDQLIRCMVVGWHDGKRILCIDPRGVPAADQYLINKFFHYSQVVYNRHITVSEWMAEQVIFWLRHNNQTDFPKASDLLKWVRNPETDDRYVNFTDHQFWNALEKIVSGAYESVPHYIKVFSRNLLRHDEPESARAHEIRIVAGKADEIQKKLKTAEIWQNPAQRQKWFTVLNSRTMTKQPTEADFEAMEAKAEKEAQEAREKACLPADAVLEGEEPFSRTRWFMEGICVSEFGEDGNPDVGDAQHNGNLHLLCADPRSLMRDMHTQTVVILRSYKFPENTNAPKRHAHRKK